MHVKMSCPKNESMWKKELRGKNAKIRIFITACFLKIRQDRKKFAPSRLESVKVSKAMYYTYSFGFKRCNIVQHFKLQEKYNEKTYF